MKVRSFKDSSKKVVKIGDRVLLMMFNGRPLDTGTVERIEKEGYFITVFVKERPLQRFYPMAIRKI